LCGKPEVHFSAGYRRGGLLTVATPVGRPFAGDYFFA